MNCTTQYFLDKIKYEIHIQLYIYDVGKSNKIFLRHIAKYMLLKQNTKCKLLV